MALRLRNAPEQALELVRAALAEVINQPNTATTALAATSSQELNTAAPHPVYVVGLKDVAEGSLLTAARLASWRYLILKDESVLVAAEVSIDAETLNFSHINQGLLVQSTVEGVTIAEKLDAVQKDDYELRLLDIPALYVTALWLSGKDDLIIPIPPTRSDLNPYSVYSEADLVKLLQPAAHLRMSYDV